MRMYGQLVIGLQDGTQSVLKDPNQCVGLNGAPDAPSEIIFKNNGLHIIVQFDANHPIGQQDCAGIKDIIVEAAVTTIQDLEDSVSAVDAEDKVEAYRNWLGLMRGTLQESLEKNGKTITRQLNADRHYQDFSGTTQVLKGRSLMLLRNVGHLMTNPAILLDGEEIFEGIMDALITPLLSLTDLRGENPLTNSRTGSMYIVKPKMHGPEEVAFSVALFSRVEQALNFIEEYENMNLRFREGVGL